MLVPLRPDAQRAAGRHGVDHAVALDHRGGGEAELAGERAEDDVGIVDVDQALILVDRRLRVGPVVADDRSEEHTSELQSLMRISYAVFCLTKKQLQSTT